jgi:hypothetical protein
MSTDTNKYILRDIVGTKVFEPRVSGKHGRKDIGGCWKSPKKKFLMQRRCPKMTSWMLKINVLVGEN